MAFFTKEVEPVWADVQNGRHIGFLAAPYSRLPYAEEAHVAIIRSLRFKGGEEDPKRLVSEQNRPLACVQLLRVRKQQKLPRWRIPVIPSYQHDLNAVQVEELVVAVMRAVCVRKARAGFKLSLKP